MPDAPDTAAAPAAAPQAGGAAKASGGAAKPKMLLLVAMIAGPLLLGGGAGALLLGPKLVGPKTAGAAEKHSNKHAGKAGEADKSFVFKIDNLIVNPAGSQGSHFLMTQIAIQCEDEKQVARLRASEFQVKDLVISAIERQSLEELTMAGARDSIKVHILHAIWPIVYTDGSTPQGSADEGEPDGNGPIQVFLPQFVIQ